jgi:hypothetical protein
MNSNPTISATALNRPSSIKMLVFLKGGDSSSTVASRITAVTASQRLMSKKDKGKFKASFLNDSVVCFCYCFFLRHLSLFNDNGFSCGST